MDHEAIFKLFKKMIPIPADEIACWRCNGINSIVVRLTSGFEFSFTLYNNNRDWGMERRPRIEWRPFGYESRRNQSRDREVTEIRDGNGETVAFLEGKRMFHV